MRLIDADELLFRLRKRDSHTLSFITSVVENLVIEKEDDSELFLFTKHELQYLVNDITHDVAYTGSTDNIPSDYSIVEKCRL